MRRVVVTVLVVYLGLSALAGCGSPLNILPGREGNGTGTPIPPASQSQVTSVSPDTAVAGAASFTLTVNGLNFDPTTAVLWDDNTSLTTTYISPTLLQAQVPASLLAKPTTITIIPSPVTSFNFGATFTINAQPVAGNNSFSVSTVPVKANDIEWDQVSQQLYLSVASGNGTNANTIAALNPQTGVLGSSVSTGSEPHKLAISTDGAYIYAGLDSAGSVQRYTLPALQPDIAIPLGTNTIGPYYAIDVQPEPGNSHSVAISRGVAAYNPREIGGILIYDDAVARPQSVLGFGSAMLNTIDSLLWNPNGQSLYGSDTEFGSGLYFMSTSSSGVQLQTQTTPAIVNLGNYLHFEPTTGYIYSDTGKVIDPATDAVIGSFPLNAIQGGIIGNPIMVPDGKLNIAYFLVQSLGTATGGNYVIEAFDLTHFTFLGAIPITNVSGNPSKMFRWGSNGLAFLTNALTDGSTTGDGVYLVSGGFVTSPAP